MNNNPFNALTEEDKDLISDYIKTWGPTHPDSVVNKMQPLETILQWWNDAKSNLFKMFGGNDLILRRPYAYTITEEGMVRLFAKACCNSDYENFYKWYRNIVRKHYGTTFGFDSDNAILVGNLLSMIEEKALCKNSWHGDTFILPLKDENLKVQKGMKPMKVLAKFADAYDCPSDLFENFRLWHSRMLNQKTLDGELCLSIHPLDFMTMSDNDSDWESCMHWITDDEEPGDYRAGTVEMMNSPCVIVAYLHNPKHTMNADIYNWEWNSKKWRELFIVKDSIISEVKGYPYQDGNLTNTVLMWIKELAHNNLHWEYNTDETNVTNTFRVDENTLGYMSFTTNGWMYNDMKTLNVHRARINSKILPKYNQGKSNYINVDMTFTINYGGTMSCMYCGKPASDETKFKDDSVYCNDCERGYYCARCGDWIYDNPIYLEDYDEPICSNCYEYETSIDDLTDEVHITEHMCSIYLAAEVNDGVPTLAGNPIQVYYPGKNNGFLDSFNLTSPREYIVNPWHAVYYVMVEDAKDKNYIIEDVFHLDEDTNNWDLWTPVAS